MARYPNYDASRPTDAYQGYAADAFSKQRTTTWTDPTGGYIHAMHRANWGGYHYRINGRKADGEVAFEGGWQNNRQSGMHNEFRMVENVFEELDAPGEWFHNAKTNTLYYKPVVDMELPAATVEVVRLHHLIEFQGTRESPVKFITLSGFVFRHAARTFMETKEPLLRSDWAIYRGGSVVLTGTEDISVIDSEFDQVGGNAIFVNNYNRRTLVKGCHIHDAGASGVCFVGDPAAVRDPLFEYGQKNDLSKIDRTPGPKTENYPGNSTVEDCLIHGVGRVERQPAGVLIEMAMEITVRDCSVYDCARAGINIGDGCWGGHLINRCDVFDTVLETHDHGSFNSWGRDRYWRSDHLEASQKAVDAEPTLPFLDAMKTTVIRNSRWRCDHGWDIDLDDGSSNYDIYNNLLLHGGLKFREGFRRRAWNNITVNNGFHPHVWFNHSEDEVFSNIFMASHRGARMPSDIAKGKRVDGNLFFSLTADIKDRFVQFGWDVNSIAADPMFVAPVAGDFRVKEGSPAFEVGFRNFPMDQFGVKKPNLKAIAKTPVIPALHDRQQHGRSAKPPAPVETFWLGAKLNQPKGDEYSAFGVNAKVGGVALADVAKSSEAAEHGLLSGDLIQGINDKIVSNTSQLFSVLSTVGSAPLKLNVVRNQQMMELSIHQHSSVLVETASAAADFKHLPLPTQNSGAVTANHNTNNDPLESLLDGKLGKGFGPVFSNGIHAGAYRIDLGEAKLVAGITSWSYNQGGRGPQRVTLYGGDAVNPGWNSDDFKPLGTIDTTATPSAEFTAASLQAARGKSLGTFRWILWKVSPVTPTAGGENTAFQELAVEIGVNTKPAAAPAPTAAQSNVFPGEKADFRDFYRYQVQTAKGLISVVCPKQPAPGKPWLWRSMFWGLELGAVERVTKGDLTLLEKDYHVVIVPGDASGHASGNANIDAAYETLTKTYGFSKTLSMASMSRETLALFRWAAANPEKVESLYVDNGVCNILSWPAGKLVAGNDSVASGNPESWTLFKKTFGFASDAEALASKESPIDLLEPLAKAGIPILMGCGTKDIAVPYEENGAIMKARYETFGGSIRIITEDKGHHPHGLEDPTPVIEFILKHTKVP